METRNSQSNALITFAAKLSLLRVNDKAFKATQMEILRAMLISKLTKSNHLIGN